MPRRLRIEFDGAIYHVMTRGNARQNIVHDDDDRRRLLDDLERTVVRSGWELVCFVVLSNHLHLLLKTPDRICVRNAVVPIGLRPVVPGRRRGRPGHLFQGRYKAEMIEDERDYWTVSRYIHLNPVRAGLAAHPVEWPWSSYAGYAKSSLRHDWVAYGALLAAWRGEFGGAKATAAYRRFVEAGLAEPLPSPFRDAFGGWVLGSDRFLTRLRSLAGAVTADPPARGTAVGRAERRRHSCGGGRVLSRRSERVVTPPRFPVSPLGRRLALPSLHRGSPAQLAVRLGLSGAASVPNLTRRLEAQRLERPRLDRELDAIMRHIGPKGVTHPTNASTSGPASGEFHGARKTKGKG